MWSGRRLLAELIEGHGARWHGRAPTQNFNAADRIRRKKDIAADIADIGRDVINDQDTDALAHRMYNFPMLICPGAIVNAAIHGTLR